jgi:hypothetical protein
MPATHTFDLSTGEPWHGVRPGMSRAEATLALQAQGAEVCYEEEEPDWMLADGKEWSLEMHLAEGGEQRIRQLSLDNWNFNWRGQAIANQPLHDVLAMLGDAARDAMWRPEDAVISPFKDLEPLGPDKIDDESLLDDGTLWLRQLGIGLVMCSGKVNEVAWRPREDVPTQFAGPVTDSQKQLSADPDAEKKIREHSIASLPPVPPTPPNPFQRIVTVLHILTFIAIGYLAFLDSKAWHQASEITGKLVGYEKASRKPWIDFYQIEYQDAAGRTQLARLRSGEFYTPPKEIGDTTQIFYVDGNPPRVKGPAHARDAAFIDYTPWFIAAGASYLVLWAIAGFVWRLKCTAASSNPTPPSAPSAPPVPPSPFMPDRGK